MIFIVYSDSIYYYIVNDKMDSPAQDKLILKDKDVLKNKEWTDLLMNKIDEYIGSIAGNSKKQNNSYYFREESKWLNFKRAF